MKNKLVLTVLIAVVFFASCGKEWLDVNKDPNNPETASSELVFPAGVVSIASQVGGYYTLAGGFWSQYFTQSNAANQYKYLDQYSVTSDAFNGQWTEMYAGGLSDLNYVIKDAQEKENWTFNLMATVMQAYGFSVMVDFYNDIPYTEAFQGASVSNFSPKYDNGHDIYMDLIARIDDALAKEETELTPAQANSDFVFGGDYNSWVKFANTLKLKMYLRMAYAYPAEAQAGVAALYADGAEFLSADAALKIFIDEEGKDNPFYASNIRKLNVSTNLRVSTTIYRYYEENSDSRLNGIIKENSKPMPQGGFNIPSNELDPPTVAVYQQSATNPVYFISDVESYLLQAEAVARGWGSGNAQDLYNSAVIADFARKGLTGYSYVATGGVYEYPASGSLEEQLEAICMAKWAAFVGTSQTLESFFETNRLGYPKVGTKPAWTGGAYNVEYVPGTFTYSMEGTTSGAFPKRMLYPQDEINLNVNAPDQTKITDKVWWDKK